MVREGEIDNNNNNNDDDKDDDVGEKEVDELNDINPAVALVQQVATAEAEVEAIKTTKK